METVNFNVYQDAIERVHRWWQVNNKTLPANVLVNGNKYSQSEYEDAIKRVQEYITKNKKNPETVRFGNINTAPTPQPTPTPTSPQTETIYLTKNPSTYVPQVYMFQEVCQKKGYYQGYIVDGKFGDGTEAAVLAIQKDNNIRQTGGIGCLTWIAGVYAPCPFGGEGGSGSIQNTIQNTLGQNFSSFTQFYNLMKGRGYSYYYNDIKTLYEEESTLAYLNCTDASQLSVLLAREMGYEAKFVKCVCKSGSGHIKAIMRGNELGSSWVMVDMAACLSVGSQYDIGNHWCSDVDYWVINDPWIENDDGKT